MEFSAIIENFNSRLWGHHIKVPEDIAARFISGTHRRVICTFNQEIEIRCALMGSKSGWFILLNQSIRNQLGVSEGDTIRVNLEKDHSEFGFDMPEELEAMLDQDLTANAYFRELTKGKQRNLIYIVNKVKNTDSRINKALAIVHHLKEVNGKLDFKKLNEMIKYYNNLHNPKL